MPTSSAWAGRFSKMRIGRTDFAAMVCTYGVAYPRKIRRRSRQRTYLGRLRILVRRAGKRRCALCPHNRAKSAPCGRGQPRRKACSTGQKQSSMGLGFSQTAFQKIQKDILKHCWPTGRGTPIGHKGTCKICRRKIPKKWFKPGLPAGKSMRGFFKTLLEGKASLGQNRQGKSVFCIR